MIQKIRTYREGDQWFFDDRAKGIEHEEFIEGVPELFYLVTGDPAVEHLDLEFSTEPFDGAIALRFVRDELDGVVYEYEGQEGWLCPVFREYLKEAPRVLCASVRAAMAGR